MKFDIRQVSKQELNSTQLIRLIDIFIYAPILVLAGTMKTMPQWIRIILIILAIGTIIYNSYYYFKYKSDGRNN